jgi:hypothetical protein
VRQLQLVGQNLRTCDIADLQPRAVGIEQRPPLRHQRLQQGALVLSGHSIEQRLAQRGPHLPERFGQIGLRQRCLQGGAPLGPTALPGLTQQEIHRQPIQPGGALGRGGEIFGEQLHARIGALRGGTLPRGHCVHLGALLGEPGVEPQCCGQPLRAVPAR